jgi:hypothetical protein
MASVPLSFSGKCGPEIPVSFAHTLLGLGDMRDIVFKRVETTQYFLGASFERFVYRYLLCLHTSREQHSHCQVSGNP